MLAAILITARVPPGEALLVADLNMAFWTGYFLAYILLPMVQIQSFLVDSETVIQLAAGAAFLEGERPDDGSSSSGSGRSPSRRSGCLAADLDSFSLRILI